MPKLSVIMSVFNSASYLKQSIDSVLDQSMNDFEFIIIDDASTDNSCSIIQEIQRKDSRIRLIKHSTNKGLSVRLNEALDLSNGEYVARMDADDVCLPFRFHCQLEYLDNKPEVDICGSYVRYFGSESYINKLPCEHDDIIMELLFGCPLAHPTVVFRRKRLLEYNLRYCTNVKYAQDYNLWVSASRYLTFANISKVLLNYRYHSASISSTKRQSQLNSAKDSQLELFVYWGVSKEDFEMYSDTLNKDQFARSLNDITLLQKLFQVLISLNLKNNLVNQTKLESFLSRRLFWACFYATKNGIEVVKLYFSNKNTYRPPFFKILEFYIRAFLKVKR